MRLNRLLIMIDNTFQEQWKIFCKRLDLITKEFIEFVLSIDEPEVCCVTAIGRQKTDVVKNIEKLEIRVCFVFAQEVPAVVITINQSAIMFKILRRLCE